MQQSMLKEWVFNGNDQNTGSTLKQDVRSCLYANDNLKLGHYVLIIGISNIFLICYSSSMIGLCNNIN